MSLALLLLSVGIGCDTVEPVDSSTLVVEGFLNTGSPLPDVLLRRTVDPDRKWSGSEVAVTDAHVELAIRDTRIHYQPDPTRPGRYNPVRRDLVAEAGSPYHFVVDWGEQTVEAEGILPPKVDLVDVDLTIPEKPVSAVFLDSLSLGDTLATGAYTGYIYPIEVSVMWAGSEPPAATSWVRVQLKPYSAFSSTVIDLFLESDVVLREVEQELLPGETRRWRGLYAVGVPNANAPLPEHLLRVSVVRSGEDYARFATSKNEPDRREPITNLEGAVGIFTAVSVDSLRLTVSQSDR